GFLITSLPEIFYDSLVYHLGIPKTYLIEHSLGFLKYNFFQTLTGICEHIFIWLLALGESQLCRMFNLLLGAVIVLAAFKVLKKIFSDFAAVSFCLLMASVPMYFITITSTGSETLAMFFMCASFISMIESEKASKYKDMSFLLFGLAAATKYTAFFGAPLLFIWAISKKDENQSYLTLFIRYGLIFSLPLLPHFIRNLSFTGNPFYPYLYGIFGFIKPDPDLFMAWKNDLLANTRWGVFGFFGVVWDASLRGVARHDFLGPIFIAFAPFLLFLKNEKKHLLILYFAIGLYVFEFQFTNILRMFLPFQIVFILPFALTFDEFIYKRLLKVFLIICVFFNLCWQGILCISSFGGFVVRDLGDEILYLSIPHETLYPPSCYPAYEFLRNNPKYKKVLIIGDARNFYCPIKSLTNTVFNKPPLIELFEKYEAKEVLGLLKKEGFDTLLINRSELGRTYSYKYDKEKYFDDIRALLGLDFNLIFEYESLLLYEFPK
ncbi:MAG: glycosyltransferase family 39 protein, partial [bacterium]